MAVITLFHQFSLCIVKQQLLPGTELKSDKMKQTCPTPTTKHRETKHHQENKKSKAYLLLLLIYFSFIDVNDGDCDWTAANSIRSDQWGLNLLLVGGEIHAIANTFNYFIFRIHLDLRGDTCRWQYIQLFYFLNTFFVKIYLGSNSKISDIFLGHSLSIFLNSNDIFWAVCQPCLLA